MGLAVKLYVCLLVLLGVILPTLVAGFCPLPAASNKSTVIDRNDRASRIFQRVPVRTSTVQQASVRFKTFDQMLASFQKEPVVVYFSAENCKPCQLMKKELAAVKEIIGDQLKMFSVDTEKWPQVGPRYDVSRLPCLVLFRDGEVMFRLEGLIAAEKVAEQVRSYL